MRPGIDLRTIATQPNDTGVGPQLPGDHATRHPDKLRISVTWLAWPGGWQGRSSGHPWLVDEIGFVDLASLHCVSCPFWSR